MSRRPTVELDFSEIIKALTRAGTKGLTTADLTKRLPKRLRKNISSVLTELKANGSIRGPFKIGRSASYFEAKSAPTSMQLEVRIQELLLDAGISLTSRSLLEKKMKGFPEALFKDALSSLKAEGKIVEFKGPKKTTLYVHRDPILEQLRLEGGGVELKNKHSTPTMATSKPSISLDDIRPAYQTLKSQQGGIGAVKIYDILKAVGGSKEDLHRLLLAEAQRGRVTLHPANTVNFSREIMEAGIAVPGQPNPFVTVVLKD